MNIPRRPAPRGVPIVALAILASCHRAPRPPAMQAFGGVVHITVTSNSSCAVRSDGAVYCWGSNAFGLMGDPGPRGIEIPTASWVPGLRDVADLATTDGPSCALMHDGPVACRRLGPMDEESARFERVPGLCTATQIAVSGFGACARCADGKVACWGGRPAALFGDDARRDASTAPRVVPGLAQIAEIALPVIGLEGLVTRGEDGLVRCVGSTCPLAAQDIATPPPRPNIATVPGVEHAVRLATGGIRRGVLVDGGAAIAWGPADYESEAFDPTTIEQGMTYGRPASLHALRGVAQIAFAPDHACVAMQDGTARC